jgi:hypothetical protein
VIPEGTAANEAEALATGHFGPLYAPEPPEDASLFAVRLGRVTDFHGDMEFEFTVGAHYALQEPAEVILTAPDGRMLARRELLPQTGKQHVTTLAVPWSGSGPYRAALYREAEIIQELIVEVPAAPPLESPSGLKLTAAEAGEEDLPQLPVSRPGFLSWEAVPGTDHYEVEFEMRSASYIRIVTEPKLELEQFGPPDLGPGRYQMTVSAIRGGERSGLLSAPDSALREISTSAPLHFEVIPAAGN